MTFIIKGFQLWLTESEQATPMDSINDVVRSSVQIPEFEKHLKKAGVHIGRNVVEITIKMKTIVRKPLMIKNTMACFFFKFIVISTFVAYFMPILSLLKNSSDVI